MERRTPSAPGAQHTVAAVGQRGFAKEVVVGALECGSLLPLFCRPAARGDGSGKAVASHRTPQLFMSADRPAPGFLCGAGQRGTSLIEILVTIALSALLATMGVAFSRTVFLDIRRHDATSSQQQAAATAVDLMVRDIQMVGCAAGLSADTGLRKALPSSLQIATDLNADGDNDDANERVTYALNNDKATITRASGDGSPQPLLRSVAGGGLRFSYDSSAGTMAAPGTDAAALRAITAVEIDVTLHSAGDGETLHLSRVAALRNR